MTKLKITSDYDLTLPAPVVRIHAQIIDPADLQIRNNSTAQFIEVWVPHSGYVKVMGANTPTAYKSNPSPEELGAALKAALGADKVTDLA